MGKQKKARRGRTYKVTVLLTSDDITVSKKKSKATIEQRIAVAFEKKMGLETGAASVELVKRAGAMSRANRFDAAVALIGDALDGVEELKEEMQQWRDSLPENFATGDKAQEIEECITDLEHAIETIENAQSDISPPTFPGMF